MGIQIAIFTVLATVLTVVFPDAALAADGGGGDYGLIALASAIAIAGAAIGAALGQGRGLTAAMLQTVAMTASVSVQPTRPLQTGPAPWCTAPRTALSS